MHRLLRPRLHVNVSTPANRKASWMRLRSGSVPSSGDSEKNISLFEIKTLLRLSLPAENPPLNFQPLLSYFNPLKVKADAIFLF